MNSYFDIDSSDLLKSLLDFNKACSYESCYRIAPSLNTDIDLVWTNEASALINLWSKRIHLYYDSFPDIELAEFPKCKYLETTRNNYFNHFNSLPVCDNYVCDFSTFCRYHSNAGDPIDQFGFIDIDDFKNAFEEEQTVGSSLFDEGYVPSRQGPDRNNDRMQRIVKSLLFHIKFKLKRRKRQGNKSLMTSLIIANHFHIFSSESDSNNRTNSGKGNANFNYPLKAKLSPMAA